MNSMEEGKRFLTATDVAGIMECSTSRAYSIIRQLNSELEQKHYLTVRGKINAQYFMERTYNGEPVKQGGLANG